MKLNFGHGIFAFYCFFMAALAYQVYLSTTIDHTLVADDYYALDLSHQATMDARSRAQAHPVTLIQSDDRNLILRLPAGLSASDATLHLQRPDARAADREFSWQELAAAPTSVLDDERLMPGLWLAKLSMEVAGATEMQEFRLILR